MAAETSRHWSLGVDHLVVRATAEQASRRIAELEGGASPEQTGVLQAGPDPTPRELGDQIAAAGPDFAGNMFLVVDSGEMGRTDDQGWPTVEVFEIPAGNHETNLIDCARADVSILPRGVKFGDAVAFYKKACGTDGAVGADIDSLRAERIPNKPLPGL